QPVPFRPTKAQIRAGLWNVDFADEVAGRRIDADPILLRVGPSHATPHIPVDVDPYAISKARRKVLGEYLVGGRLAGGDVHVKDPHVRAATMSNATVDDVELFLVRRERKPIR